MPAYVTQAASGKLASYDGETMIAMHVDSDGKAAIEAAALANGTVDISTLSELTSFELARTTFTAEADLTLGKIDVAADENPYTDTDGETVAGVVVARQAGGSDAARTVVACHTFTPRAGNTVDAIVFAEEFGFGNWRPAPGAIVRAIGTVTPDAEGVVDDAELAALLGTVAGVPTGGSTGQALVKASGDDYDTEWSTISGGTGSGTLSAYALVADADLTGGAFTTLDIVEADGTLIVNDAPRALLVGLDVAVRSGTDGGSIFTVTASGACTLVHACDVGEVVTIFGPPSPGQFFALAANDADDLTPGAADRFLAIAAGGGGGDITTDAAWAAKGDIIAATGNNAAAVVTVGANDTMLMADSAAASGVKWANASTVRTAIDVPEALGTVTGLWLGDAAAYAAIGSPSSTVVYVVVP